MKSTPAAVAIGFAIAIAACSSTSVSPPPSGTGGASDNTGGSQATGNGGGVATSQGGKPAAGGAVSANGGAGAGGKPSSGGASATGGDTQVSGGTTANRPDAGQTGGSIATGGAGISAGGSSTGSGTSAGGSGTSDAGTKDATNGSGGASAGGSTGTFVGTKTPGTAQTGDITVNPATTYQTMDGFGIADVWIGKATHTAALRTLFWDPVNGIGMSLLRVGIEGKNGKPEIMGDAAFVDAPDVVKFGGKVWAAPWTPPANIKDNNNVNNGGHLNTASYDTWASTLAAFPAYFKQNAGVDLWGISAQNEPDFVASYESCIYNASQMNAFIKVLGPKLKALNPPVALIAAEPDVWTHTWNDGDKFGSAIIGDSAVSAQVDIIATHDYGSNNSTYTRPSPPAGVKQHVWETEIYYTSGAGIGPGLDTARGIYSGVTGGGVSGWHYWWTTHFMDGGSASSPPKRVYTMGNYSKFVRPGYVRVGISGVPSSVHMVPFVSPADGTVAIVALNEGSSAQQVSFFVSGAGWPTTVTPYVTSSSSNLEAGTAIPVTAGRFSGSLAAQSVTTFVGKQ